MTLKIVGLVGEPLVGKDTIADIAIEKFDARRIAFAEKIYSSALAIDPIISLGLKPDAEGGKYIPQMMRLSDIVSDRGWRAAKDEIPEVRRTLQRIGTEMGRDIIDPQLWVGLAFRTMMAYYQGSGFELNKFVFTDVRFPNEEEKLRSLASQGIDADVLLVRVRRPGFGTVNNHASESSYDTIQCDDELNNDGSLDDLKTKTNDILGNFFGDK